MKKSIPVLFVVLALSIVMTGCLPGPNEPAMDPGTGDGLAGFWMGLWHGVIVVVSFIVSLFSDNVNVYEVHNNGGWYNFGFVLGLTVALGGGGKSAHRRSKSD